MAPRSPIRGVLGFLNHQPTPDNEQNDSKGQSQEPIRDVNCHPAADDDTGDRTREQRGENDRIDGAEEPMADTSDQGQWHGVRDIGANDAGCGKLQINLQSDIGSPPRPLPTPPSHAAI